MIVCEWPFQDGRFRRELRWESKRRNRDVTPYGEDGRPRTNIPLQHLPHPGCPAPKQVPDLSLPPTILHVGPSEPHASEAAPGDDLTTFTRCAESSSTRLPSNPTPGFRRENPIFHRVAQPLFCKCKKKILLQQVAMQSPHEDVSCL